MTTDAADEPPQISRMKAVLHGMDGLPSPVSCDVVIGGSQYDPPSYVVKLVLLVLGVPHFETEEKSEWQVYVRFEGFRFRISDWKHSSWSVHAETREPAAAVAGSKMIGKIRSAAKLLDDVLSAAFKAGAGRRVPLVQHVPENSESLRALQGSCTSSHRESETRRRIVWCRLAL
jgi:hypothetical protein